MKQKKKMGKMPQEEDWEISGGTWQTLTYETQLNRDTAATHFPPDTAN